MTKQVFLHIGPPKTGTTFIQQILWTNRERLASAGIVLPLKDALSHRFAARTLWGDPHWTTRPRAGRWNWHRLVEDVEATEDSALVSAEALAFAQPEHVALAIETLPASEVHVIATIRDVERQILSVWQNTVKNRGVVSLEEFVRQALDDDANIWRTQDVPRVLKRWLEHVPASRIHVLTLPGPGSPTRLLWTRFADVIGVDPDAFEMPDAPSNVSLDAVQAEVLRRFNAGLGDRLPKHGSYQGASRSELLPALGPPSRAAYAIRMPAEYRGWAVERSERMAAELQQMGVDVRGDWQDLVPATADEPSMSVSPEQQLEVAIEALRRTVARADDLRRREVTLAAEGPTGADPAGPQGVRNQSPPTGDRRRAVGRVEARPRRLVIDRPLAIVDSPFQLLSLYEAVESGAVSAPPDVVIRARESSVRRLVDLGRDRLADVVPGPVSHAECLRLLGGRPEVAVGDPFSGLFHTALALPARPDRRMVLLEDGASALRLLGLLAEGKALTRAHDRRAAKSALAGFGGWRLRRLTRRGRVILSAGLPMNTTIAARLTERGIDVRPHRFEWSRTVQLGPSVAVTEQTGAVHVVLGSSLANDGMLTSDYYRSWLASTLHQGSLFVPHRREPGESRRIVERAGAAAILDGALPVELLLRDVGAALHVDCLPTTAALTVPLVRGDRPTTMHCARPPESAWSSADQEMRRLVEAIQEADLIHHEAS